MVSYHKLQDTSQTELNDKLKLNLVEEEQKERTFETRTEQVRKKQEVPTRRFSSLS